MKDIIHRQFFHSSTELAKKYNCDKSFKYKTINKSNAVFNKLLESPSVYSKPVQEKAENPPSWQRKSPKTLAVLVRKKY
jgi:hypothetical protein